MERGGEKVLPAVGIDETGHSEKQKDLDIETFTGQVQQVRRSKGVLVSKKKKTGTIFQKPYYGKCKIKRKTVTRD